ncbi:MAG: LysM peptidoglycan-binding domain-containing protein [Haliscomenobacteraceae bacterium CHB4]|nr:LysM peptidoglycan-binding domain-containing protein [Haliscomenobacteraceae bacterium CHB4]
MQLRNPVFCWLTLFLTLFAAPLFSQNEGVLQDADLPEPDTTGTLVAKGGLPMPTDAELKERLSYLSSCVELKTHPVVKGYIRTYVQLKTDKSRTMLGKRLTYFPLFEQKLKEYGLPTDLKYLSVVESALNPKAVSRVGATGLWQFMPATGAEYGLRTTSVVEDRSDPVKSTDAAARHLKDLFNMYNDWALALAAYNSGAGRVNAAIKRAHSRDFWSIQRYLPKETRNYVPAFIAATYICNYYTSHGLIPYDPDYDEQLTSYIKVFEGMSFRDIADATGIDYQVVKTLNPGFRRDYVPPTASGHFVILPERVMPAFLRYLNSLGSRTYTLENNNDFVNPDLGDGRYWHSLVNVQQPEHIETVAQKVGCNADHLKAWNKLATNYVNSGQNLKIMHPVYVQKHSPLRIEAPAQNTSSRPKKNETQPAAVPVKNSSGQSAAPPLIIKPQDSPRKGEFQYHTVQRNESLGDIARQYATSAESILKLNGVDNLKVGMRLKIREY